MTPREEHRGFPAPPPLSPFSPPDLDRRVDSPALSGRLNRRILTDRLKKMYGKELSDKYIRLLKNHHIYKNDETSLANYCASITMYPWLLEGTKPIGGLAWSQSASIDPVFMIAHCLSLFQGDP